MEHHSNKGIIDNLRPKAAFKAGFASGLAVVFVIGFFVLLGFVINGKVDLGKGGDNSDNGQIVVDNGNGDLVQPSQQIKLTDIDKNKDWIRGDKNAEITIVEFSDIDCPYCARFHTTMQEIMASNDNVRWVFKHFPLDGLHPEARKKAEAVECVGEQGGNDAVWNFMDKLFSGSETLANISDVAASVGVDKTKFEECLDSGKYANKVQDHSNQAKQAGASGTPYSVIVYKGGTSAIPGALPTAQVQSLLDSLK